jgi:ribosomal protein S12 methylthiotransferase
MNQKQANARPKKSPPPTKVGFVALGCAKNIVDSEKMLGQLIEAGCVLTSEENADVIVVNTCGFLEASRTEADEVIAELTARKDAAGEGPRVVVAGCLVERDGTKLIERHPAIDALVGVHRRDDVVRAVRRSLGREPASAPDLFLGDYHVYTQIDTARLRLTPQHYAYLRISEGCNQKCTFCTIPSIRGTMRSKPMQALLAEARELSLDGAVELNLIGQDTTSYGHDLDGTYQLSSLLSGLDEADVAPWIRLLYVYPSVFTDEMIDTIAASPRICKYIDIPLQHINDGMLKAMARRVTRAQTEALLDKLRTRIPEVAIRTTMIAGFPGETDAQFEELLQFIKDFRFDALGVFPYSLEPDTPSGRMSDHLPEELKDERVDALMEVQQEVAFALGDERIGKTMTVLVDDREDEDYVIARHAGQAPEVDSVTWVASKTAQPGQFLDVRCVGRQEYDLVAEPADVSLPIHTER